MEYKIVIPSYKRAHTIVKKTLPYLQECSIDMRKIYVFVADDNEYLDYVKEMALFDVNIVVGVHTLRAQRNFIIDYFLEGEYLINIDDDIDCLMYAKDSKLHKLLDFDEIVNAGYQQMIKNNAKLFGIYAVSNHFFMSDTVSTDNKYICGGFFGNIVDKDDALKLELEDKEDFERSILYYKKFGVNIRLNNYTLKTNAYKGIGGMQETRTKQRIHESAIFLAEKYPDYCKINTAKKNKEFTEVKLITPTRGPKPVNLFDI